MEPVVHCVVLAAGESSRYGRTKLLAELRGEPLLCHALKAAHTACPGRVCLVTGNDADAISHVGKGLADNIVHNPEFASGIGSSIRSGIHACGEHADALLIVLADQPLVTADHLSMVVATWDGKISGIVATAYADTIGPPVLFGSSYFEQLGILDGDAGAKAVLHENLASVQQVPFESAAFDIDTPEDLDAINNRA